MGSKASEDSQLMRLVTRAIKKKGLIFVDSQTSTDSVAYRIADQEGLICGYNEIFLDSIANPDHIAKQIEELVKLAKDKGKVIVIAHPRSSTINVLKSRIPSLKEKINFITIKEYFNL